MLFRSKTAIKVRFQKLFNTKDSKAFYNSSISMEILQSKLKNSQQSMIVMLTKTLKFSALTNNLSNVYKAEQHWRVKSQLDCNGPTPPSGQNDN